MQLPISLSFRVVLCAVLMLAGCERLGIADPVKEASNRESDARATGGACRHAGRALEDCYTLNPDAGKAAVFAGWKEMNDYMRENKIEDVKPIIAPNSLPVSARASAPDASSSAGKDASSH